MSSSPTRRTLTRVLGLMLMLFFGNRLRIDLQHYHQARSDDASLVQKESPAPIAAPVQSTHPAQPSVDQPAPESHASAIDFPCVLTAGAHLECLTDIFKGGSTDSILPPNLNYRLMAVSIGSSGGAGIPDQINNSCGLDESADLQCWGSNVYGQLGNGTEIGTPDASPVRDLARVRMVSAGPFTSCAVTSIGAAMCWGLNDRGQLGDGTTKNSPIPVQVVGLTSGVVAVSVGDRSACAQLDGGALKCWGSNTEGVLGDGSLTSSLVPVSVDGIDDAVDVSVDGPVACAATRAGQVKCWGELDTLASLSRGRTSDIANRPRPVTGLVPGATSVSVGGSLVCAVTKSGIVECWGWNGYGQLGDGTTHDSAKPVRVKALRTPATAVSVDVAGNGACALTIGKAVRCWGGQFPLGFWVQGIV